MFLIQLFMRQFISFDPTFMCKFISYPMGERLIYSHSISIIEYLSSARIFLARKVTQN